MAATAPKQLSVMSSVTAAYRWYLQAPLISFFSAILLRPSSSSSFSLSCQTVLWLLRLHPCLHLLLFLSSSRDPELLLFLSSSRDPELKLNFGSIAPQPNSADAPQNRHMQISIRPQQREGKICLPQFRVFLPMTVALFGSRAPLLLSHHYIPQIMEENHIEGLSGFQF